jgi:RNA polymerase sigma-70 factor, ECF subfamily
MEDQQLKFREIYAAYQSRILRYLIHLVGETEAEDLAQEVFVKAQRGLGSFRGESTLATWLYRIATHTAIDKIRTPAFQRADPSGLADEAGMEGGLLCGAAKKPAPEQQLLRDDMSACVRGYVEQLPQDYRTALVLSEFEGLRNKEIAAILGVSLETVKVRLHRAKEKLGRELAAHCDRSWIEENEFLPDMKDALEAGGK